jgi:hypothetical protein
LLFSEKIAVSPCGLLARVPAHGAGNDTCAIQNKSPSAAALGDWFPEDLLLISKASPNGWLAIIIVIIVVGEENLVFHKLAYYSTILMLIRAQHR